ncbi:hypothetical protein [Synechococcus sp. PCC 7336]|uniref:hypothetical protein n=1 Tax=Synechococcus sp. PCC 7336 TaxID=195250 RepID=UPI000363FC15
MCSSVRAKAKARKKRTEDNLPVHSFQTLLADLATIAKNQVQPNLPTSVRQVSGPHPLAPSPNSDAAGEIHIPKHWPFV